MGESKHFNSITQIIILMWMVQTHQWNLEIIKLDLKKQPNYMLSINIKYKDIDKPKVKVGNDMPCKGWTWERWSGSFYIRHIRLWNKQKILHNVISRRYNNTGLANSY